MNVDSGSPAGTSSRWHRPLTEAISDRLAQDPDVLAVVVGGSLADQDVIPDRWSDVDLMVVLEDGALDRYYRSIDWLAPFGQLLGAERHDGSWAKTLRVSLVGPWHGDTGAGINRRLDLVLVPASSLDDPEFWERGFLLGAYTVVWSRLPGGDAGIEVDRDAPPLTSFDAIAPTLSEPDIAEMADAFWFKAVVAIGKVVRSDLLIGGHLALDLARDCLVLQMMRRDRALGTTVHRTGGWGNTVVGDLWPQDGPMSSGETEAGAILDLIERCAETFDALAAALVPGTPPRAPLLRPSLRAARTQLADDGDT